MRRKFLVSLLLCGSMVLSPVLGAEEGSAAPPFSDVERGSWYEEGVQVCAEEGVMVGTGEGKFSPGDTLSRAECLALALRLYDLQNGGDGTLEKAPEEWGKITMTLADGAEIVGYGDWDRIFSWGSFTHFDYGYLCANLTGSDEEQQAWGKAHEGPATVTVGGQTYPGTVDCWIPMGNWILAFHPEGGDDSPAGKAIHDAMYSNAPGPDTWYRDAVYTAEAWGLTDPERYPTLGRLGNSSPANRTDFAMALHETAGELPQRLTIDKLPDLNKEWNPEIYRLYEAGILTGVDEYGTFNWDGTLTRAETAVMVARVLDERLRVNEPPRKEPDPVKEYTLTYLMDGASDRVETYPVCVLSGESGGVLTIDGTFIPWNELPLPGGLYSSGLERNGDYCRFSCWNDATEDHWDSQVALMDREGNFPVPFGAYDGIRATADGHFIACRATYPDDPSVSTDWFLLEPDGTETALCTEQNMQAGIYDPFTYWDLNDGLCPRQSAENGLWGYVDATGAWVMEPMWQYAHPFCNGYAVVKDAEYWKRGVIDTQGNVVIPCWYDNIDPFYNSPGYDGGVEWFYCWGGEDGKARLAAPDGRTIEDVPAPESELHYQNGYAVYCPPNQDGQAYLGPQGQRVSQWFDWTGPIGPDGRGFVGLDEKIYRIEFQ